MPFIESPRFPESISYGSRGGPGYQTTIVVMKSGNESRNVDWSYPLHDYDAAFGIKTQDDLETVLEHFHVVAGRAYGFRYKDWLDYKSVHTNQTPAATDQLLGTGDGNETDFQLIKTYVRGSYSRERIITKPVSGTVLVALNDVAQGSGWSVDTTTGIISFTTAPGNGVTVKAGFEFDLPCRFNIDRISIQLEDYRQAAAQVPIFETRDIS